MVGSLFALGFSVELMLPVENERDKKGLTLNCLHAVWFTFCDMTLGALVGVFITIFVFRLPWHGLINLRSEHRISPSIVMTSVTVAAADFLYYWFHRLQHASRWLWPQHELHHSDEHMNVTTSARAHWLETVLQPVFVFLPLAVIFDPPFGTAVSIFLFWRAMVYFIHLDARIRFGWFNRIFSSPQSHRIHHSQEPKHIDKNFAILLPAWDIIFGTYYHPEKEEWPRTGVEGVEVKTLWQAIVLPFESWKKMLRPTARLLPTIQD